MEQIRERQPGSRRPRRRSATSPVGLRVGQSILSYSVNTPL